MVEQEAILDAGRFIDKLVSGRVAVVQVVPSYLEVLLSCLAQHPRELPDLRCVSVTGEALKKELVQRWFAAEPAIKLVNAYGLTETSDDTNHEVMDRVPERERVPLGRPINNVSVYVVDEHLSPVPLGAPGEIVFSGVCVGRGYINDPERTRRAFMADPHREGHRLYRSGDYGRWLPEGKLKFLGRRDAQVKISGFRIEIGEIENRLLKLPGVREGAVVVTESADKNKHLVAFCSGDRPMAPAVMRDQLATALPQYMVPSAIHWRKTLPLTENGKIDRKALLVLAAALPLASSGGEGGGEEERFRWLDLQSAIGFSRRVELRLTERAMSPAVCGLLRPVILLPQSLVARLSPEQLRAVLLHEWIHLRRGDVWVNCLQALLQIFYWWHPLLWLANARIRRVREKTVLFLYDLATGREREITTQFPITGSPAWSPDGTRLVFGVRVPNAGSLDRVNQVRGQARNNGRQHAGGDNLEPRAPVVTGDGCVTEGPGVSRRARGEDGLLRLGAAAAAGERPIRVMQVMEHADLELDDRDPLRARVDGRDTVDDEVGEGLDLAMAHHVALHDADPVEQMGLQSPRGRQERPVIAAGRGQRTIP